MARQVRLKWLAGALFLVACSSAPRAQPLSPTRKTPPEVVVAPEIPVQAPPDAIFLAQSGVVTFDWSLERQGAEAERGQATLRFDHWGRRQASFGYPGPVSDKVVIIDKDKLTSYLPAMHVVMVSPFNAIEAFSEEERRTLQKSLPDARQTQRTQKRIVGLPCTVVLTERRVAGSTTVHTECSTRGVALETTDVVSGGPLAGLTTRIVATSVDFGATVSEAVFAIPKDVPVSDLNARLADPEYRKQVMGAARINAAKADPALGGAPPAPASPAPSPPAPSH